MNMNRVLMMLVGTTLLLQGAVLYKQYYPSGPRRRPAVSEAPQGAVVDLKGLPVRGAGSSPIVLVEFSDYECPFCARHAKGVGHQVEERFVDTGLVRHAFAHNPLKIHPSGKLLATAAICAGSQNQYWRMHDILFEDMPKTRGDVLGAAQKLPIDNAVFERCLDGSGDAAKRIDADIQTAKSLGLTGTPAFALGRVDRGGKVHVEKLIMGAVQYDIFESVLNESLGDSRP